MIDGIEISPSSKAKCQRCHNNINIGEPRLKISYRMGFNYYCYLCSDWLLESEGNRMNSLRENLKEQIEECKGSIVAGKL